MIPSTYENCIIRALKKLVEAQLPRRLADDLRGGAEQSLKTPIRRIGVFRLMRAHRKFVPKKSFEYINFYHAVQKSGDLNNKAPAAIGCRDFKDFASVQILLCPHLLICSSFLHLHRSIVALECLLNMLQKFIHHFLIITECSACGIVASSEFHLSTCIASRREV